MITPTNIIIVLTVTATALMAGLFYSWSVSVTNGLALLPDETYLAAFQSMNRAILNPAFLVCFLGTAVLLPVTAYLHYHQSISPRFVFFTAAAICYLIGVMGITMFGNVPLNEMLDAFDLTNASKEELAEFRAKFEGPWNGLHSIRTFAAILSIILVAIACVAPHDN